MVEKKRLEPRTSISNKFVTKNLYLAVYVSEHTNKVLFVGN